MTNNVLRRRAALDAWSVPVLRFCHYCGAELRPETFTLDHVVPRWISKTNVRRNFVPACPLCNNKKGNRRSPCRCWYCEEAWSKFSGGEQREVQLMSSRVVGFDELEALRVWSDVSETRQFVKPMAADGAERPHIMLPAPEPQATVEAEVELPPVYDFGVKRSGELHIVRVTTVAEAEELVAREFPGRAWVVARKPPRGRWLRLSHMLRYYQPQPGESDGQRLKRLQMYWFDQLNDAHAEIARLKAELADQDGAVPMRLLQDLPAEWRTMTSLRVDDVARELEAILERWRERWEQEAGAREVANEAGGGGPAA